MEGSVEAVAQGSRPPAPAPWLAAAADEVGVARAHVLHPTERDILANGVRLHLLEWGGGSSEIVLLHGGSLSARTWDLVCLLLGQRHHCLAVDLRGHGDSEWPANADYRLGTFAQDVREVIANQTSGRPLLVGHSLGGLVAMKLFEKGGVDVRGLVLVDISPSPRAEGRQEVLRFLREHHRFADIDDLVEQAVSRRPQRSRELVAHGLLSNLRQGADGQWTWKWDRRRLRDRDAHLNDERELLWRAVGQIQCPVLIVRGVRSKVLLDGDVSRLAACVPDARSASIQDAGHTVQSDNPRELAQRLEEFLACCP